MRDIISSIIIIITCISTFIIAKPLGEDASTLSGNAALFPQIISVILGLLGVAMLIKAILKDEEDKIIFNKKAFIKVISLIGILIVYIPALQILGYLLSTILFLFVVMIFLGNTVKKSYIQTLVISVSLYIIFAILFNVPLPKGILW